MSSVDATTAGTTNPHPNEAGVDYAGLGQRDWDSFVKRQASIEQGPGWGRLLASVGAVFVLRFQASIHMCMSLAGLPTLCPHARTHFPTQNRPLLAIKLVQGNLRR
jgi:hypothetical protein